MNRIVLFAILLSFLCRLSYAQTKQETIDSILSERGEVFISVPYHRLKSNLPQYENLIIDKKISDRLFLYLTVHDSLFIEDFIEEITIQDPPSMQYSHQMADSIPQVLNGTAYPTYGQYLSVMQYFADKYPAICTIDTIGFSVQNRLILAARLTKFDGELHEKPVVFISSTIHGDELPGYSMLIMLINKILKENDQTFQDRVLKNSVVIIAPLENPDGTYANSDTLVSGARRTNANYVDLNRNYPDFIKGENPDGHDRQKETLAMMQYLQSFMPSISANIHAGAEVVNYPWDNNLSFHPDDEWFNFISREYADTARYYYPGYMNSDEFDDGVIRGALWYIVYGGRQDYVTYFLDGRELTLELSEIKSPPAYMIPDIWNANYRSLLNLINQGSYGIHGKVFDTVNNKALRAMVIIEGYDQESSGIESNPLTGYFFRYLKSGIYTLSFSVPGYEEKTIENIEVKDYETTEITINMVPLKELDMKLISHPFSGESIQLEINSYYEDYFFFSIYNLSGVKMNESFHLIEEGKNIIEVPVNNISAGIYILKIKSSRGISSKRIVKLR